MKRNRRKFSKGRAVAALAIALTLTSCGSVSELSAKIGIGGSNPEEIVEITPSEVSKKPLRFGGLVIPEGVSVGGVPVGGLTDVAAYQKLLRLTEKYEREGVLELTYGSNKADLKIKDLKLEYELEKPVKEAFRLQGKAASQADGTGEEKLSELVVELPKKYETDKIDEAIKAISKGIYEEPVDDTIEVKDGEFSIKKGKPGKGVDSKKMKVEIESAMDRQYSGKIEGVAGELEQKTLKESDIARLTGVIGSSSTYYNEGNVSRSNNVKRSAACFNGLVVRPGETVSFNQLTDIGGYEQALVIDGNGDIVMGVGGGLCQTATTLFQAAVHADMTIVESNCHSLPSEYTELAKDAMVSGWSDLKFRNDLDFPVIIQAWAGGGEVHFEFLGDTEKKNYEVNIVPGEVTTIGFDVKEVEDPTVTPGDRVIEKQGQNGYRVATYIYNGRTGETYKLRDNYYETRTQVVRVNNGLASPGTDIDKWLENYLKELERQENPILP